MWCQKHSICIIFMWDYKWNLASPVHPSIWIWNTSLHFKFDYSIHFLRSMGVIIFTSSKMMASTEQTKEMVRTKHGFSLVDNFINWLNQKLVSRKLLKITLLQNKIMELYLYVYLSPCLLGLYNPIFNFTGLQLFEKLIHCIHHISRWTRAWACGEPGTSL